MSARGCPGCADPAKGPRSPHFANCSFVNALGPTYGELEDRLAAALLEAHRLRGLLVMAAEKSARATEEITALARAAVTP